jgi:REP element-mobilizing transposase RayT
MGGVSRLRRLALSDRFFFVTCRHLPKRGILSESEFACLARAIHERRRKHGFLVTAWVFLPDHWHAIVFPRHPFTISEVMESIKVSATKRINRARGELGLLWQGRFFDRALRTVKEYQQGSADLLFRSAALVAATQPRRKNRRRGRRRYSCGTHAPAREARIPDHLWTRDGLVALLGCCSGGL